MKYIIYLTRNKNCTVNNINRVLIGVHKTENPEIFDGYLGDSINVYQASSFMYPKSPFQCSVKKYGVQSFERYTLEVFDTIEEAFKKFYYIADRQFSEQSFTYNVWTNYKSDYKPLYQFDLNGNLLKKWNNHLEAYDFFNYPREKFAEAIKDKFKFLDSYWSLEEKIDITKYNPDYKLRFLYLYNNDGKLYKLFSSIDSYLSYFNCTYDKLKRMILNQNFDKHYVSNKLSELFTPKPRRNYMRQTFYVYKKDEGFLGSYYGKKVMNVIKQHSWRVISNIFNLYKGWYGDYYLSLEEVNKVPEKTEGSKIEVYDKVGNFIERIYKVNTLKEKYNLTNAMINSIKWGKRYYGDYIFKYNSK